MSIHWWKISFFAVLCQVTICQVGIGQDIRWNFSAHSGGGSEITLLLTADLTAGWHIYSQHIQEGGPVATHIAFASDTAYTTTGETQEQGNETRYYDSLYEMEIGWYADQVSFSQRIILKQPIRFIKGTITYMICNKEVCVPKEEKFKIDIFSQG